MFAELPNIISAKPYRRTQRHTAVASAATGTLEQLETRRLLAAAAGNGGGLLGTYFNNSDFTQQSLARTDGTVNFTWGNNAPAPQMGADTFSVRWTGQVQAQYSELYTFYTNSDDGVRLWVNGQQLINHWDNHGPTEDKGTIWLTAGQKYDIKMEFYENGWGATAQLSWSSASQWKQIIPQSQLYSGGAAAAGGAVAAAGAPVVASTAGSGDGMTAEYFDNADLTNRKVVKTVPGVNFTWGSGSPDWSIGADTFSARWSAQLQAPTSGNYQFFTTTDDGVRLWVDDKLIIDHWTPHSGTTDQATAWLSAGRHNIKMEYYEQGYAANAKLEWIAPGGWREVIPQKNLFSVPAPAAPSAPTPVPSAPATAWTPAPQTGNATPAPGSIVVGPWDSVKSIQQAINMAQPGQTIFIRNGVYNEAFSFNRSGAYGRPITIQGQSTAGVIINAGGRSLAFDGQYASNIVLKNVTIQNANNAFRMQNAAVRTGPNWWVQDVVVQNNGGVGIEVAGSDSTFTNVTSNNNGQLGWGINGNRVTLKNCGAMGNNTKNFNAADEAGGAKIYMTNGVTIDGGVWAKNEGPAIWFDWQNRNYAVRNTEVYGNWNPSQAWTGVGITVEISDGPGVFENNYIHDNSGAGVGVWESQNVTVRNNRMVNDTFDIRSASWRPPGVLNLLVTGNTVVNGGLTSWQIPGSQFASRRIYFTNNSGI